MRIPEVRPYWDALNARYRQLAVKRALDVVGALGMLAVLSPVIIAAAAAVKIDSSGPILYRQERVTQYGRHFRIHKFRTMIVDADKKGALVTTDGDSRITRVGKYLRQYRIDEFPQLVDILSGDMTFVGTRPEVPKYVDAYEPEWLATLLLPAGVTSKASIKFKDEAELMSDSEDADAMYVSRILPKKMLYNLDSVMSLTVKNDLLAVIATVSGVFSIG